MLYYKRGQEEEQRVKESNTLEIIAFCPKKFIATNTMVYCFVPTCSHSSESHTCKFFAFPSDKKEKDEYKRWIRLIRFVNGTYNYRFAQKNILQFGNFLCVTIACSVKFVGTEYVFICFSLHFKR